LAKSSAVKGDAMANKTVIWSSFGNINMTAGSPALQYAQIKPLKQKACEKIFTGGPYFTKVPKSSVCMEPSTTVGMCMVMNLLNLTAFNILINCDYSTTQDPQ
jgi:hypothetical protein